MGARGVGEPPFDSRAYRSANGRLPGGRGAQKVRLRATRLAAKRRSARYSASSRASAGFRARAVDAVRPWRCGRRCGTRSASPSIRRGGGACRGDHGLLCDIFRGARPAMAHRGEKRLPNGAQEIAHCRLPPALPAGPGQPADPVAAAAPGPRAFRRRPLSACMQVPVASPYRIALESASAALRETRPRLTFGTAHKKPRGNRRCAMPTSRDCRQSALPGAPTTRHNRVCKLPPVGPRARERPPTSWPLVAASQQKTIKSSPVSGIGHRPRSHHGRWQAGGGFHGRPPRGGRWGAVSAPGARHIGAPGAGTSGTARP
jgi:hypothetical protein